MKTLFDKLYEIGIVPVVKIQDAAKAADMARALQKGGIPAAEITFRTEQAADAIRRIAEEVPDICVCAGTILTEAQAKQAVAAGAKAIISPGSNPGVIDWCLAHAVEVIPGCATPSEIEFCIRKGLKAVKLFPAEVIGGVRMLKALSGPYPEMWFMPTGGISEENLQSYLALPNVLCCGGSWIVPGKLLENGNFMQIEVLAAKAKARAKRAF
ncbi:bifunctional 4-hydroxy-2-oxoglutarate aldolase/2-dehydro-3-deoxy-phosphogluconate aldolase [Caproiciproducens galactitolivorans]|uniref:2-dehydro-3-deoxy-phosphogluconate aldolase n=1 Tax=Caproiciproducens galactitolivorans TaxID=642589 RepID=A0A4Z0Y281_9FIRM|nr:bifunctional 4-hydroxy-2-oxoglutarate aldolase/2-dehydro-3-deoxy-phosphogluconate aldolase [Caproiciproducens galactitolivorans]QEY35281.1 bifunctional 4-hydroxy-2-oxoglutarate aldolase/2-dehydro-3-deoxy-phosphogluconate aldolase [Caproiciproducens galactitolivorans]TGJ76977.1 putative KHG/KDPG aldolase [Caproiciproducens galactitolivorans]